MRFKKSNAQNVLRHYEVSFFCQTNNKIKYTKIQQYIYTVAPVKHKKRGSKRNGQSLLGQFSQTMNSNYRNNNDQSMSLGGTTVEVRGRPRQ